MRMLAEAARGRTATPRAVAEWVARHLEVDPQKIDADTVPDPAAITVLEWAKANAIEFWRSVHAKLMPSQAELQEDQELAVGDRRLDDALATCKRVWKRQEEERLERIIAHARAES
jgi:hypothetical protein